MSESVYEVRVDHIKAKVKSFESLDEKSKQKIFLKYKVYGKCLGLSV